MNFALLWLSILAAVLLVLIIASAVAAGALLWRDFRQLRARRRHPAGRR